MLRAVRFCLMIEGQEGVTWKQWLALAEAAERLGFEGLFRSDHYFSSDGVGGRGSTDAWTLLAALAARTDRIRLGTLVSPVTFRLPSVLAKSAATVDEISGGRVEIGMGAGWWTEEHTQFGFPFPPTRERFEMLEEQLEIVHRSAHGGSVLVRGHALHRSTDAEFFPKPVQRPRPPIVVGGKKVGPWMQRLIGAWADEFNTVGGSPDGGPRALRTRARRRGRRGARAGHARHVDDDVVLRRADRGRVPREARARPFAGSDGRAVRRVPRRHRGRLHRGNAGAGGRDAVEVRGRRRAAHHAEPRAVRRPRDARTPCHASASRRWTDDVPLARRAVGSRSHRRRTHARSRSSSTTSGS